MSTATQQEIPQHLRIAEQGKVFALQKDFVRALAQLRQAIKIATQEAPQSLYPRHYMECTLEILEWTGAFPEILSYCEKALAHYQSHPPQSQIAAHDHAHIYQRQAVIELKTGAPEAAKASAQAALSIAQANQLQLPLVEALHGWLLKGFQIPIHKVEALQQQHRYFSIRQEQVESEIGLTLPDELLFQ